MRHFALPAFVALLALVFASPVSAFQCPKLVKQLQDATGNRYDATAADAKLAAARAQALHAEGKHAEAEQLAKDALAKLGIKA